MTRAVKLSEDQLRLLHAFGAITIRGPQTIISPLRYAFAELEMMKLIEPITEYRLTDAGRLALKDAGKEEK